MATEAYVEAEFEARLPFEQTGPLQVAQRLRELQAEGPIHRVQTALGDPAWLVTRDADVRRLLADDRLGRGHPEPDTAPRLGESLLFGGPVGNFETEKADTARMRELLQPHFTPRHMRALAPRIEALTARLLDELEEHGSPADLHAMLAVPLPILVICELLGVPYEDRDKFQGWVDDVANTVDRARSEQGVFQLFTYGQQLVTAKRDQPADDVISRLAAVEGVSDLEVAGMSMALLFAGHETTVVQIGLSAMQLLADPGQWQALVDNPALVPTAIEETLRVARTRGFPVPRYARTDFETDGVQVKAGELVLLDLGAANLDPSSFAEPDRIDLSRSGASHLALGYGIRYCLGAPLARVELQAVFTALVARFPTLRLAVDVSELKLSRDALTGGITELPVRW